MERYDIVVPKEYEKNGEKKTVWNKVGTLTFFPANGDKEAGYRIELPIFGHDNFKVFKQKPREEKQGGW